MLSASTRDDLVPVIESVLARRSLTDFMRHMGYETPRHIQYLIGLLERVEHGEIKRLAISAPPGHGKSTLLQNFVAWYLGRDPRRRILCISASESLAKRNSRDTQHLVTSDEWPWPDVTLANDSVFEWSTKQGGEVRAIGKGGTVTGFRAEMALIDDLQSDAGSDATRESDAEWFRGVFSTRLEPNGVCVIIQTRWSDADVIGQLLNGESADQWTYVNLAVFAEPNDPLGREAGEVLWPERWNAEAISAKRAEVGSAAFGAQYLGNPVPAGGKMFAPEWFENRYDVLPAHRSQVMREMSDVERMLLLGETAKPPAPIVIQSCDSAWKDGLQNDRSVIATLLGDMRDIYVMDLWFGRVQYPDLRRIMQDQFRRHTPSRLYVEEAASGFALVQELRTSTGIPIIGIPPGRESKAARAEAVTGLFEAGRIKFPKSAPWMEELLGEFLRFPFGRHDDIVDAVVLGVSQMWHLMQRAAANDRFTAQLANMSDWMVR